MADVNTYICTPDQYKSDALVIAQGNLSFNAGFSATGLAPVTHWLSGGFIPQAVRDSFAEDPRFTAYDIPEPNPNDLSWRTFAAGMGLLRVVSP